MLFAAATGSKQPGQSPLIPTSRMRLPHTAISPRMVAANSSGLGTKTPAPAANSFCFALAVDAFLASYRFRAHQKKNDDDKTSTKDGPGANELAAPRARRQARCWKSQSSHELRKMELA